MKKRDSKMSNKNLAYLGGKNSLADNSAVGVSPQLPPLTNLGNIGSLISGSHPGGVIMGNSSKRRLTADGPSLVGNGGAERTTMAPNDLAGIAGDLYKEYTRRLSGHNQLNPNEEKIAQQLTHSPGNYSNKSNQKLNITTVSNFMNSPRTGQV